MIRIGFRLTPVIFFIFVGTFAGNAQILTEEDQPLGVLIVVGDIARCDDSVSHQEDEHVALIVQQEIEKLKPSGVPVKLVLLGDLAYDRGTKKQFQNCFDPAWGQFKDLSLPVPGNHEYDSTGAKPYFAYFEKSPVGLDGKPLVSVEDPKAGFYATRFPDVGDSPWLLLGLNPYSKSPKPNDFIGWLGRTLEENKNAGNGSVCVLAFAHPFLYSSGLHGHNDVEKPGAKIVRLSKMVSAFSLLHSYKVSVLLSGHDHHFEQFGHQDKDGNADPTGVRTFIVGTGGGKPYLQNLKEQKIIYDNQASNQEEIIGDKFGVLKMKLYKDRYDWEFIATSGEVIIPKIHEDICNILRVLQ